MFQHIAHTTYLYIIVLIYSKPYLYIVTRNYCTAGAVIGNITVVFLLLHIL